MQVEDPTVDNLLDFGLRQMGLSLPESAQISMGTYVAELLRWNKKINLTAITKPDEVVDKHLLDSLSVLPEVNGATRVLDIGSGAGFPGLPLALAMPDLQVTLVDSVGKKVGFLKHMVARLDLSSRVNALHLTLQGQPTSEGLKPFDLVIARAFADLNAFRTLAAPYLSPGGRVVAMLGKTEVPHARHSRLPISKAPRAVAVFPATEPHGS